MMDVMAERAVDVVERELRRLLDRHLRPVSLPMLLRPTGSSTVRLF